MLVFERNLYLHENFVSQFQPINLFKSKMNNDINVGDTMYVNKNL
jgi:hypothetical protein